MVAGLMAGLLGIGGGLILIGVLVWLLPTLGVPQAQVMHVALASAMASIVVTGMSSSLAHHRRGSVLWPTVGWMIPGLLLGGWLGSGLAVLLDEQVLRWVVAVYCVLAAVQLQFGKVRPAPRDGSDPVPRGWWMSVAGTGIGILSAVVGIGGGSMTVPLLVWRGVLPVRAVGSSSAAGVVVAIASAAGFIVHAPDDLALPHSVGYVYLPAALGVSIASMFAAPWGTRLAHQLSPRALRTVFAGFMVVIGTSLVLGR
ncbi:MAG: sulfite exporter TauE/SafE family protein [Pseudoxanthomonas sp.]